MSLSINNIHYTNRSSVANSVISKVDETALKNNFQTKQLANDAVSFSGDKKLSIDEQKALVLKARTKAAGYSCWFSLFSLLYYGLRSNKTVAKKYNLDVNEDEKLIKNIKKSQIIWTLPSIIPYVGIIGGLAAYLYNKNTDASSIDLG